MQLFWARFFLESIAVHFSQPCALVPSSGKRLSMLWVIVSTLCEGVSEGGGRDCKRR